MAQSDQLKAGGRLIERLYSECETLDILPEDWDSSKCVRLVDYAEEQGIFLEKLPQNGRLAEKMVERKNAG